MNPDTDVSGTVIGMTLFLNWGATGLNHNLILTMNPDGKSFKGVLNLNSRKPGTPVVGNFLGLESNKGK